VAIIFAGINHDNDVEGYDRPDMNLPYGQEELIQRLPSEPENDCRIYGWLSARFERINDQIPAMLGAWYYGSEAECPAMCFLGKVNPSGKMPFTIPVSLSDSPAHALGNFPGKELTVK
jgi:beta-glucosidase